MSSTVEQETESMTPVETTSISETYGVLEAASKDAGAEVVDSQAEAIDARELKAILEAVLFVSSEPVPVARLMSFSLYRSRAGIGW
jgi:hypothetical protein